MLLLAQEIAIRRINVCAHQHRVAGLEDLIIGTDADPGQILLVVVLPRSLHGLVEDVMDRAGRIGIVENTVQQFDHATNGAMADQRCPKHELLQPRFGDGKIEKDAFSAGLLGKEGVVEALLGLLDLLGDELAADVAFPGQRADGLGSGQGIEGQFLPLRGPHRLRCRRDRGGSVRRVRGGHGGPSAVKREGVTRKWDGYELGANLPVPVAWVPVTGVLKAESGDSSGLRANGKGVKIRIHVCLLHETGDWLSPFWGRQAFCPISICAKSSHAVLPAFEPGLVLLPKTKLTAVENAVRLWLGL